MAFGITVEYKLNVIQQHDMASKETIVVLGLHQQDYSFQIMASNTSSLVCVDQIPARVLFPVLVFNPFKWIQKQVQSRVFGEIIK